VEQDDYVQPALKGVLNVLKSCSRAKSVRRVVYTSSVAAACPLNEEGELMTASTLDESTWTPVDFLRKKPHPVNVCIYSVSRLIEFLSQIWHNINVVIIMCVVLFHLEDFGRESSD
jgi:nucleoside-diphosphate-sugar epimerase